MCRTSCKTFLSSLTPRAVREKNRKRKKIKVLRARMTTMRREAVYNKLGRLRGSGWTRNCMSTVAHGYRVKLQWPSNRRYIVPATLTPDAPSP